MTTELTVNEALPFIRQRCLEMNEKFIGPQTLADANRLLEELDKEREEGGKRKARARAMESLIERIKGQHAFPSDDQVHREHCDVCEAIDDYEREQRGDPPYEEPSDNPVACGECGR